METEQLHNFNERLSQWVANQGFWFQIRYSMSGSGVKGRMMFHLLRLGFRLLIFLVLVALGSWAFLLKRTDSERFKEVMRDQLKAGLSATEVETRGVNRVQGQLEISRLAAEGDNETFFTALEAKTIRCKMGLLDGLLGTWDPGVVSISKLELDLRAGTDDAESADKLAKVFFGTSEAIKANAYEVADATLRWGYSERTKGSIESSVMRMQRTETGWRISFKGGLFHQNWLHGLQIVDMVVLCEPAGLLFEKAELKLGSGTVDFSGLRVAGGERPQVQGVAQIRSLALENILPPALRSFIEGSVSGDFKVFGSTNSSDGIGFDGQVVMDGKDLISLRERLHLLKALSVVDYSRSYHRVDFREGSFQMKTIRGGLELSEVDLKADDLFTLEGNVTVRLPTQEEIQVALSKGSGFESSPLFSSEDEDNQTSDLPQKKSDFSLKRAALEAKRVKDGAPGSETISLFDRLTENVDLRRLQTQASERMSRMLRYEGKLLATVPSDAFERAKYLQELFPVDSASGRIPIPVPIEGSLYELTLKQAEDLYLQGRRR